MVECRRKAALEKMQGSIYGHKLRAQLLSQTCPQLKERAEGTCVLWCGVEDDSDGRNKKNANVPFMPLQGDINSSAIADEVARCE